MQNGVKILLIESDPACRDMVSSIIRLNFPETDVEVTGDTNEAIASLDNRVYDMVVCDAHLVAGEKMQFVRRMCRTNSPSAIVVVTGNTDITLEFLRTVTPPLCVRENIYKPIVLSDALSKIGRVIEERTRGQNEGEDLCCLRGGGLCGAKTVPHCQQGRFPSDRRFLAQPTL